MLQFDRNHIWHPYTSLTNPLPVYPVASADGVHIHLTDGTTLIDGMASWWCAIHGYNHPRLNHAVQTQLQQMAHVMFGGLTHASAVDLAKLLVEITAPPLQHVFFCDSGSVSVEVAIKMAIQYWYAKGLPNKSKLLTIRGGYHGDTFGAMAVCDPVNGMHESFSHVLPKHFFVQRPSCRFGEPAQSSDFQEIEALVQNHHTEIAAIILEPLVQGAGGMWFYSADYLAKVADLCQEYQILLIFDEIATGFGRTGKLFAYEHVGVVPDILCVGKALTGGYVSLAATITQKHIDQEISQSGGVLMHGPTFMGNPLATAVAVESIKVLLDSPWQQRIAAIEKQLCDELMRYRHHPAVSDVRVLGAIGVVETQTPVPMAELQKCFVENGIWIRPFNRLIYIMPPYIIQPNELAALTKGIGIALNRLLPAS